MSSSDTAVSWFRSAHCCRLNNEPLTLKGRIRRQKVLLTDIIEPDFGLLDVLLANGVLTEHQYADIRQFTTVFKKNEKLLELLLAKDEAACERFMAALEQQNQPHVANVLKSQPGQSMKDQFGDIRPLDNDRRSLMIANRLILLKTIDPNYDLLDHCLHHGCISREQVDFVRNVAGSTDERNRHLLDFLIRRSVADFNNFMECLIDSNQDNVRTWFTANGVICTLRLEVDSPSDGNSRQLEYAIAVEANKALHGDIYRQYTKFVELLRSLGFELKLLRCEPAHSIDCYFACETRDSVEHLHELYNSKQLEFILESSFTALFKDSRQLHVRELSWAEEEYERTVQYFETLPPPESTSSASSRWTFGALLRRAEHSPAAESDTGGHRSSTAWFTALRRRFRQQSSSTTHATVRKVTQKLPLSNSIHGVTLIDNELFVLTERDKDQVEIYDAVELILLRQQTVEGLAGKWAIDMTSCKQNRCLYISDDFKECIHRSMLDFEREESSKWSVEGSPGGLSVTADHNLLVTFPTARKLKLFTTVGEVLRAISLHRDVDDPHHAIQLSTDEFVVSHGWRDNSLRRVCKVGTDGKSAQSYGGQRGSAVGQLDGPFHLAVDGNGSILVADCWNNRVLLLSPTLQYIREVSRDLSQPHRLCLGADMTSEYLYVGQLDGTCTEIRR